MIDSEEDGGDVPMIGDEEQGDSSQQVLPRKSLVSEFWSIMERVSRFPLLTSFPDGAAVLSQCTPRWVHNELQGGTNGPFSPVNLGATLDHSHCTQTHIMHFWMQNAAACCVQNQRPLSTPRPWQVPVPQTTGGTQAGDIQRQQEDRPLSQVCESNPSESLGDFNIDDANENGSHSGSLDDSQDSFWQARGGNLIQDNDSFDVSEDETKLVEVTPGGQEETVQDFLPNGGDLLMAEASTQAATEDDTDVVGVHQPHADDTVGEDGNPPGQVSRVSFSENAPEIEVYDSQFQPSDDPNEQTKSSKKRKSKSKKRKEKKKRRKKEKKADAQQMHDEGPVQTPINAGSQAAPLERARPQGQGLPTQNFFNKWKTRDDELRQARENQARARSSVERNVKKQASKQPLGIITSSRSKFRSTRAGPFRQRSNLPGSASLASARGVSRRSSFSQDESDREAPNRVSTEPSLPDGGSSTQPQQTRLSDGSRTPAEPSAAQPQLHSQGGLHAESFGNQSASHRSHERRSNKNTAVGVQNEGLLFGLARASNSGRTSAPQLQPPHVSTSRSGVPSERNSTQHQPHLSSRGGPPTGSLAGQQTSHYSVGQQGSQHTATGVQNERLLFEQSFNNQKGPIGSNKNRSAMITPSHVATQPHSDRRMSVPMGSSHPMNDPSAHTQTNPRGSQRRSWDNAAQTQTNQNKHPHRHAIPPVATSQTSGLHAMRAPTPTRGIPVTAQDRGSWGNGERDKETNTRQSSLQHPPWAQGPPCNVNQSTSATQQGIRRDVQAPQMPLPRYNLPTTDTNNPQGLANADGRPTVRTWRNDAPMPALPEGRRNQSTAMSDVGLIRQPVQSFGLQQQKESFPKSVNVFCRESFLESWSPVVAKLASGQWRIHTGGTSGPAPRIVLCDTPLADQCSVDIELDSRAAILLCPLSVFMHQGRCKAKIMEIVALSAIGRYRDLFLILVLDVDSSTPPARSAMLHLQTATIRPSSSAATSTRLIPTKPSRLPQTIAMLILKSADSTESSTQALPKLDRRELSRARFLLSLVSTMSVRGAIQSMSTANELCGATKSGFADMLSSERIRQQLSLRATSTPSKAPDVNPMSMVQLSQKARAHACNLEPRPNR